MLATGGKIVQRTNVKYEEHAREGYATNAVIYRCIRLVADALKSVPVQVFDGDKDVTDTHELAIVLANPNPQQIWEELVDEMVGHMFMAGEEFLEGVTVRGGTKLLEIYSWRPDRVAIEPADDGSVGAFIYESAAGQKRFPVERGRFTPVLHFKNWNPTDHWRGLAPMAAASNAGDEHNLAVLHARSLYMNSATPSGAMQYEPPEGDGKLADDQWERLKGEIDEHHVGVRNAGRPFLLDGFLKWVQMGLSPKDMESGEGRAAAAREIALALGVPPLLLSLPGDNTYANYYQAQVALWRNCVWPMATLISKKLTAWVRPIYGEKIRIVFDEEQSGMAEAEKRDRWDRVTKAEFLTIDEKRTELGWDDYKPPAKDKPGAHILVGGGQSTLEDVVAGEPDEEDEDGYGTLPGAPGDKKLPKPDPAEAE